MAAGPPGDLIQMRISTPIAEIFQVNSTVADPLDRIVPANEQHPVLRRRLLSIVLTVIFNSILLIFVLVTAFSNNITILARVFFSLFAVFQVMNLVKLETGVSLSEDGLNLNFLAWPPRVILWEDVLAAQVFLGTKEPDITIIKRGKKTARLNLPSEDIRESGSYRLSFVKAIINRAKISYKGFLIGSIDGYHYA